MPFDMTHIFYSNASGQKITKEEDKICFGRKNKNN